MTLGPKRMNEKMALAKLIAEELRKVHVTEDEDLPEEWRHAMNALLSKIETAVVSAETRMLVEETERLKIETAERQINFIETHAVGNH